MANAERLLDAMLVTAFQPPLESGPAPVRRLLGPECAATMGCRGHVSMMEVPSRILSVWVAAAASTVRESLPGPAPLPVQPHRLDAHLFGFANVGQGCWGIGSGYIDAYDLFAHALSLLSVPYMVHLGSGLDGPRRPCRRDLPHACGVHGIRVDASHSGRPINAEGSIARD